MTLLERWRISLHRQNLNENRVIQISLVDIHVTIDKIKLRFEEGNMIEVYTKYKTVDKTESQLAENEVSSGFLI